MSTTYPGLLPRPQRDGYTLAVTGSTVETVRDRPAARCRAVGRGSRTACVLTWVLTTEQFAFFAGWWRHDLQQGSVPALIQLPNGNTDAPQPVRFLGPYTAEDLIGRWRVTASVELVDPPRLSATDIAGLLQLGTLRLPAADFHAVIHVLLPSRIPP